MNRRRPCRLLAVPVVISTRAITHYRLIYDAIQLGRQFKQTKINKNNNNNKRKRYIIFFPPQQMFLGINCRGVIYHLILPLDYPIQFFSSYLGNLKITIMKSNWKKNNEIFFACLCVSIACVQVRWSTTRLSFREGFIIPQSSVWYSLIIP